MAGMSNCLLIMLDGDWYTELEYEYDNNRTQQDPGTYPAVMAL